MTQYRPTGPSVWLRAEVRCVGFAVAQSSSEIGKVSRVRRGPTLWTGVGSADHTRSKYPFSVFSKRKASSPVAPNLQRSGSLVTASLHSSNRPFILPWEPATAPECAHVHASSKRAGAIAGGRVLMSVSYIYTTGCSSAGWDCVFGRHWHICRLCPFHGTHVVTDPALRSIIKPHTMPRIPTCRSVRDRTEF